ncbi:MAG: NUDIX hydrolase [candidate division WOR-3 bacterium]
MKTVFEISAGGVVFRKSGERVQILLISVKEGKIWTLPKGLVEKGERPEKAALREVKEETGVTAKIVKFIDKIDLWFYQEENGERVRHHKIVYYYLMEYESGSLEDHDFEVVDVKWFEAEEALSILSYQKDREIVKKTLEFLGEGQNARKS